MSEQITSTKIDALQAIRAFAAILVMLFHGTQMINEKLGYQFLNNIFMAGFSGVDIFFVLSGFIILYTSSPGKNRVAGFLKKRFVRIYPIYWIVTALLVGSFLMSPTSDQAYKGDFSVILGSLLLFPQKQYVLGVAWTLTYEVIFYSVFAITYFKNPKSLFFTFVIWILLIITFHIFQIKTSFYSIDLFFSPIIINFALGCLVAYFYKRNQTLVLSKAVFWFGLAIFILMWSIFYDAKLKEANAFAGDLARVYLFGLPSAIIILGSIYLFKSVPRFLVYIGDASYSLYLIHGTVLSILLKVIIKLGHTTLFNNFTGSICLFIGTLLLSCSFYSIVEKQLLSILRSPRPSVAKA